MNNLFHSIRVFVLSVLYSCTISCWSPFSSSDWKSAGKTISSTTQSTVKSVSKTAESAATTAESAAKAAGEGIKQTYKGAASTAGFALQSAGSNLQETYQGTARIATRVYDATEEMGLITKALIGLGPVTGYRLATSVQCVQAECDRKDTFYCTIPKATAKFKEAAITSAQAQQDDIEHLIPIITQYTPILYLHSQENALPICASEYFTAPGVCVKSYDGQTLIPAAQMSQEKLYELWKKVGTKELRNYYLDIPQCLWYGSNPFSYAKYKDEFKQTCALLFSAGRIPVQEMKDHALVTPAYVLTFYDPKEASMPREQREHVYLQFLFLYGYNSPYTIRWKGTTLYLGDVHDLQNAHIGDLEHITMELDNKKPNKPIKRIFYASHGSDEGVWIAAKDISTEGTHPIVWVANGGHGCYPWGPGTYVRIFGFANDVVNNGFKETGNQWWKRWEPTITRIYKDTDPRFNPTTMGWVYCPAQLGKHSVTGAGAKRWFGSIAEENKSGMALEKLKSLFVPQGSSITRSINHRATIPGQTQESGWVAFLKMLHVI